MTVRAARPEPLPMDVTVERRTSPEDTLSPEELGLDLRVTQPDPAWLSRRACTPSSLHPELTADAADYAATHGGRWVVGVMRDDNTDHGGWWPPGMPTRLKPGPVTAPQPTSLFAAAGPEPETAPVPDHPKVGRAKPVAHESFADDVRGAKEQCLACPVMMQCRASAIYVAPVSGVAGGWTEGQRDTYRAHHGIPAPDDGLDRTDPGGLSLAVLAQVAELSAQGLTAQQIADFFDSPEIDDTTVEYARQILAGTKRQKWVAA